MKMHLMFGIFFIFLLLGCDNPKNSVVLMNSYIFTLENDIAPYSTPIKTQYIKGNNPKKIEFDPNGYVKKLELEDVKLIVDYNRNTYVFTSADSDDQYDITFDPLHNIDSINNSDGKTVAKARYDNEGRIIEIETSNFGTPNFDTVVDISYENGLVKSTSYEFFNTWDESSRYPIFFKEKHYFYNKNDQLIKTEVFTYQPKLGEYNIDQNNQRILTSQEECFYTDHNKQGDWTKLYCLNPQKNTTLFNLRYLEYY